MKKQDEQLEVNQRKDRKLEKLNMQINIKYLNGQLDKTKKIEKVSKR